MSSPLTQIPQRSFEVPVNKVRWWSKPLILGIRDGFEAIQLDVITHQGFTGRLRLSLILDGKADGRPTYLTLMDPPPSLQLPVVLPDFDYAFRPCISIEFEFGDTPAGVPGRPFVTMYTEFPKLIDLEPYGGNSRIQRHGIDVVIKECRNPSSPASLRASLPPSI